MKYKKRIITIKNLENIKEGENGESLVDLKKYCPDILCDYIKKDMLPITGDSIFVREKVVEKLAAVSKKLKEIKDGYSLKVVYGYRHPNVQKEYFSKIEEKVKRENSNLNKEELRELTHTFVAEPEMSGHPCGAAVDLTIVDEKGKDLEMGTKIADFSDSNKIKTFSDQITKQQSNNRETLLNLMMEQGFAPFFGEWWHFSYGDIEWAYFYDKKSSKYSKVFFSIDLI